MRLLPVTIAIVLFAATATDAEARFFRFGRAAARTADNAATATPRVRPRPTYPHIATSGGAEYRLVSPDQSSRDTLSRQAATRRTATTSESRIADDDEFIRMSDLIGWSLDLGLSFIEWESSDRTAIEVAANRLARNNQYWASFCPSSVGYFMVPSDHPVCLDGSAPLMSATPIDLSEIPVSARHPPTPPSTSRSNFDFNVRAAQDPIWSAYYFTFRTEFPAVWSAVTDEINTGVRRGDATEVVFEQSQHLMMLFIEAQGPYVGYAEPGALIAVIDAELAFMEALSAHSIEACAEYAETGNLSIAQMRTFGADEQAAFARASTALISAMASGRRNPQTYESLDQAELDDFWTRVSSRGVSESDIAAIEAGEEIPPARMCHFGIAYHQTIAALHPLDQVRVLAEHFRPQ